MNVFDAATWSKTLLKNHRQKNRDLICVSCERKGYRAGSTTGYKCEDCGEVFGALKFCKHAVHNQLRFPGTRLICEDCKSKLRCAVCKVDQNAKAFTKDERDHHAKRGTALVCKLCRGNGYSPHDLRSYLCSGCGKNGGARNFDAQNVDNHNRRNDALVCLSCRDADNDREKRLQALLNRKDAWKCLKKKGCGLLTHDQRCRLHPPIFGEMRWPGINVGITAEDNIFLAKRRRLG